MVKIIGEKRLSLWLNSSYEDNSRDKERFEAFAAQDQGYSADNGPS